MFHHSGFNHPLLHKSDSFFNHLFSRSMDVYNCRQPPPPPPTGKARLSVEGLLRERWSYRHSRSGRYLAEHKIFLRIKHIHGRTKIEGGLHEAVQNAKPAGPSDR
ncbi:hypothetical protein C8R44DRAFT_808255 [Mycena epipterygia]|nr:hypothetical protein C8R44DRAFT_808255 [Mycena epipterygia]